MENSADVVVETTTAATAEAAVAAAGSLSKISFGFVVGMGSIVFVVGVAALAAGKNKKSTLTSIVLHSILVALALNFLMLELIFLMTMPIRKLLKGVIPTETKMDPEKATRLANGKDGDEFIALRKVVIFDGICVLCNSCGRFVVSHLPDPNLVSFLPYQDALSNPHISLAKIKQEFPEFNEKELENKIAVISGKKLLWASDAVFEVCSWMYFPFYPFMKLGYLVPKWFRDGAYMIVAKNRYDIFGTQPLEKNFAKYLCPYMYVKKYMEDSAACDISNGPLKKVVEEAKNKKDD